MLRPRPCLLILLCRRLVLGIRLLLGLVIRLLLRLSILLDFLDCGNASLARHRGILTQPRMNGTQSFRILHPTK